MEQSDWLKCFLTKTDRLKALIKKLTTQVLYRQCKVDHYPIRRTTVPVLSIFFISAFSPARLQYLLGNIKAIALLHISYFLAKI